MNGIRTAWINTFDAVCRLGDQAQAIGALGLGTEAIVRQVYARLLQGIRLAWPTMPIRERVFFELHALVDDDHAEVMRAITVDLCQTPANRHQVAVGVLQALNARASFFDAMLDFLREREQSRERTALVSTSRGDVEHAQAGSFTDITMNRDSLLPQPARQPADDCLHRQVCAANGDNPFTIQRGHPVYPICLPSNSVSLSIGELAPSSHTSNHRHAYESLIYILSGQGYTVMEGGHYPWQAGDALYVPPWCWHRHVASANGPAQYLTATNMPLLRNMGQTVLREEE